MTSLHTENLDLLACRGQCGTLFPRLVGNIPDDASHQTQTKCDEKAWFSRLVRLSGQDLIEKYVGDCPEGRYYHYNVGKACPNAANHAGQGESMVSKYVDSATGETVDPSMIIQECGHPLTDSEDHSLQASCTLGECVSTNFYQCQHRKHEFAGCGHDPLHSKVTIVSCGHYEYSCQIRSHFRTSCPRKNGERCTVSGGRYRKCDASHQHQYPSDSVADPGDSDTFQTLKFPRLAPKNRAKAFHSIHTFRGESSF